MAAVNAVAWFEIGTDDPAGAERFYGDRPQPLDEGVQEIGPAHTDHFRTDLRSIY